MDSLPRKRKGTATTTKPASSSIGSSHVSENAKKSKKKCKFMTAPSATRSSPTRGHKRKLGCIEKIFSSSKKKLESEYRIGEEIGQGKFGSVKICHHRVTNEGFAVKSLVKSGEESVHREVEIMQHLSGHPNIVALKAVFEDEESFHLVMELCEGRLLDEMVREGRYSERRAAGVVKEVAEVVKYCHEMGVVHRDVKPENVLVKDGRIKLADFGLAVRVATGQRLSGIAGSPAYVAPEVLSGHYSEKVDIWGAGVLLHALLVGVLPFNGDSLEAVFDAIKTVELDFCSGIWESISELARDLVSRMLTRDVSARITADEILRHPWILFYTGIPSKALPMKPRVRNSPVIQRIEFRGSGLTDGSCSSSSSISSSRKSEEHDECGFVDALAAAISRVRISEPKRSRLCLPANPIQQQCSSNMKANLCTAF